MPRRRKTSQAAEQAKTNAGQVIEGRRALGAMLKTSSGKKSKTPRGISAAKAAALLREVDEKIEEGDISGLSPRHWVALFCWFHEAIYDVSCLSEVRREWNIAASRASAMLSDEFERDEGEFLEYMKWAAKDEEKRELWRRSNRRQGARLGWRALFLNTKLLTDYRLAKARQSGPQ